jgi:hypothetical protein
MIDQNVEAALIIAYRRYKNVSKLIDILCEEGVKRIYLAIDRNSPLDSNSLLDVNKTIEVAIEARKKMPGQLRIAIHVENVGCSAAVLSACDWFFENEEFGLIFEDDCIPSKEFLTYASYSRKIIETNSNVWLFCGTQFAPNEKSIDTWSLSKYALIWGWGTSKRNWNQIASSLRKNRMNIFSSDIGFAEKQYWSAGARRSSSGVVDAWDNILIQRMLSLGKKAILPKYALVSNIGNDSAATHTISESSWLSMKTGSFDSPRAAPFENPDLDLWLKRRFYKISIRHIFTTQITYLLDLITGRSRRSDDLTSRWENASKNLRTLT